MAFSGERQPEIRRDKPGETGILFNRSFFVMTTKRKKQKPRVVRTEKQIRDILAKVAKLKRGERTAFYAQAGITASHITVWNKRFKTKTNLAKVA